ncbi:hypothetical protein L1987_47991 [Smallanthus sonchifolius]|uniref:Uncharacterized protein n=1 Tax=Smallanthus sonchifolius TaxID=185202 RepID=A0ACB9FQJ4_9ASTR|nr:hypothetical protein L1987_47991 [Smallanthus sonchifolius]
MPLLFEVDPKYAKWSLRVISVHGEKARRLYVTKLEAEELDGGALRVNSGPAPLRRDESSFGLGFQIDIDAADKGDPLDVVEYIDDIYAQYRKQEISSYVSPRYMSRQHDITDRMRGILIDWLIEVHYKFELMEEYLYLTVNLVDRYLERQIVTRKQLQLVGEKEMMNTLQFNLSVPTSFVFIKRFLKAANSYKEFPPSLLAAAAVFTAESTLNRSKQWTKTSEFHSQYSQNHLINCIAIWKSFSVKKHSNCIPEAASTRHP